MKMQLDVNAVKFLIERDPNFELELRSAIIANVARHYVKGVGDDVTNAVRTAAQSYKPEFEAIIGKYDYGAWRGSKFEISDSFKKSMQAEATRIAEAERSRVQEQVLALMKVNIDAVFDHRLNKFKEKIEDLVQQEVAKIEADAVKQKVEARVKAALGSISSLD